MTYSDGCLDFGYMGDGAEDAFNMAIDDYYENFGEWEITQVRVRRPDKWRSAEPKTPSLPMETELMMEHNRKRSERAKEALESAGICLIVPMRVDDIFQFVKREAQG